MSGGVPAGEGLKACPFCGMAVTLVEHDKLFVFRCPDESPCIGVGFATYGKLDQRDTAITAWNTRATPTPPIEGRDADVERVARALERVLAARQAQDEWDDSDTTKRFDVMLREVGAADDEARAALQALGERG